MRIFKERLIMGKLFEELREGLEEALAHKNGKIYLRSISIELPEPPAEYKPKEIKSIRKNRHYSQGVFAKILNVSLNTVRSWKSGNRRPSHAALRLLEIIDKGIYCPEIIKRH